jgi:branched-chain amino acid transport system substrate-binding protein
MASDWAAGRVEVSSMYRLTRGAFLGGICVLAVALPACGAQGLSGEAVIYVVGPLSGDQADGGQSVLGGARKRADEANKQGGVLGHKVVVRGLDDQADEDVAAEMATKIADAAKGGELVLGVVGHYNSGPTGSALAIYRKANLVVVTPSASNPDLSKQGYTGFFRVCATDSTQGPFDAKFLRDQGYARVVLARTENDYAVGLAREFKAAGGAPVAEVEMKAESPSASAQVQQVKAANPDAVFFAGDYPDGITFVRDLRRAGVTVPVLASDANFVDSFIDELGAAAEGIYVSAISPDPRAVAPKEWFTDYQTLEARNPGIDSTTGYSAADVLINGVKKASRPDTAAVAAAIHGLDIKTLVGRVRYDANGDLLDQQIYIFRIEGGRFTQHYPKPEGQ